VSEMESRTLIVPRIYMCITGRSRVTQGGLEGEDTREVEVGTRGCTRGCVRGYMQSASVERLGVGGAKASRRHPRRPP